MNWNVSQAHHLPQRRRNIGKKISDACGEKCDYPVAGSMSAMGIAHQLKWFPTGPGCSDNILLATTSATCRLPYKYSFLPYNPTAKA